MIIQMLSRNRHDTLEMVCIENHSLVFTRRRRVKNGGTFSKRTQVCAAIDVRGS